MTEFSDTCDELAENADALDDGGRLHRLFDAAWDNEMAAHPERATSTGHPGYDHLWTDLSPGAIERRRADLDEVVRVLDTIERAHLDEDDRLSYDLFRRDYELRSEGTRFPTELLPVTRMGGIHEGIPRTISLMRPATLGGYENLVARLHGVSVYVDQAISLMEDGLAAGVTPPRITLEPVPGQVDRLLADDAATTPLLAALRDIPRTVPADEHDYLRTEAAGAYDDVIVPALGRLRAFLVDRYLPACRQSIAATDLPDGDAWYAYDVRRFTTTAMQPAEIHEIGLQEVARIRKEMEAAITATGFTGTFEAFVDYLRTDDAFYCETAEELLQKYRDIAKRIDPELIRLFGRLPRLPYGVAPVPAHEEQATTTAYYMRGSPSAGRPGWFFANTWDLRSRPTWEMEALTLHEAVPGHHLQIALAAELDGLPRFRALSGPTAFVEGWGLYAESLGTEIGTYTDPYARFGQLTYEMWRAVRLVVDTGMHALGWTRDQAIEFFQTNSSKPIHDITVEIDRYISWPAQALAYKIGDLKLKELRARATTELGERFDVRAFHDRVLEAGAIPLSVLEERVVAWIAEARG
jgi:uncharacterized protein (DUF885 family)